MRRRQQPEAQVQRSVISQCRGARGAVFWHTPNGGWRSRAEGAIFKSLGVLAGVSDVCILHDGRFYALELKAAGGRCTEAQIAFRDAVNAAGGFAAEAVGLDAALACLQRWGLLMGRSQ